MSKGLSVLGSTVTTGVKVIGAGLTAAAGGVMALGTAAVSAYADYEQLVGGIETLFGAGGKSVEEYAQTVGKFVEEARIEYSHLMMAQEKALDNANKAYETAGLSANAYMESVTSIAASLKQSTASEMDAVNAADQAIIDMADNANKMGTSMESIQNAYQGFAKQNYTMLDNLKLGYGGTKEEMHRLLEDATALSGIEYDINNLADVYSAIHVIQDELGITGTTAKEASTTISGSVATMKGAWTNFVAGLANKDADFSTLADNVADSLATVIENIMPVAKEILPSIVGMVEYLLPLVVEEAADALEEVAPDLLDTAVDLLDTVITMLIDYIPTIVNEGIPYLLEAGLLILTSIMNGLSENLPTIVEGAMLIVNQLATTLVELLPQLLEFGLQIIVQLALGIAQALPELIPTVVTIMFQIVDTLINNIDMLVDAAIVLLTALTEGIINALPILIEKAPEIIVKLVEEIVENAPKLLEAALKLILTLAEALINYVPILVGKVPELITTLKNKFIELVSSFRDVGKNIVEGIANGITEKWDWLVGKAKDLANALFDSAKAALEIQSPSKKFRYLGEMCIAGWEQGSEGLFDTNDMTRNINASLGTITANVSGGAGGTVKGVTQYITINKEDSSPDELARAIRLESRYRLMGGYA